MNTAKLKVTAGCRDLLGVQKHANQHRLSRLAMEVHNDELRIIAAAVESYTDELIAALEAAQKRNAELEARTVTLPRPACTYADHSYPAYSEKQVVELLESLGINLETGGE
ncbi:hypothetical protein EYS39_04495 [Cronobacter sakazakii]|uniref:hypothetical protein n=1 Tax=Cronobacter sakazakii TaxID=28141 RepID=UPI00115DC3D6|nr:hypothetical protein [Cronobacter sakazakii]TQQ90949.1 hypothetical protein EYS39_04495 [Cronobacter sakazakii]